MRLLKPGGKLVLVDWFRDSHVTPAQVEGVVAAIESGMLLPRLETVSTYVDLFTRAGGRLLQMEDISRHVARTWDIGLQLVASPSLWALALAQGTDFVGFLRAFVAMREGYATGAFRCVAHARGYACDKEGVCTACHCEGRRPARPWVSVNACVVAQGRLALLSTRLQSIRTRASQLCDPDRRESVDVHRRGRGGMRSFVSVLKTVYSVA